MNKTMLKKANKIAFFSAIGIFAAIILITGIKAAIAEEPQEPPTDSRITAFTVTPANIAKGATTTYNISFNLNTTVNKIQMGPGQSGVPIMINFHMTNGICPPEIDWSYCQPDLSSASISGISLLNAPQKYNDRIEFVSSNALSAGTNTFSITGVKNPQQGGGNYVGVLQIMSPTMPPGEMWPEKQSSVFQLGNIAFTGKVLTPDGDALNGTGVNIRSADFSYNNGTGTDQDGNFVFLADGLTSGATYFLEVWVPGGTLGYISPDPIEITYNGSPTNLGTITLARATKTIKGKVTYNTGGKVTTAQVNAWKQGGSGVNADVDSNGEFELSVGGGTWEININPQWDPETQQQVAVDWSYNMPPQMANFANNNSTESKTINFVVEKTNAIIKGCVKLPSGAKLTSGWVDIRSGEGFGGGTGLNWNTGCFLANVKDGSYKLTVNPDNQNPNLAKYYLPEMKVEVSHNQTLNLGTLTMKMKTSKITGKVKLEDGTGVSGVRVNCWQTQASGWGEVQSGNDGSYSLWLNPGKWECRVQTGGDSNYIPMDAGGPPKVYNVEENQTISGVNHIVKLADATITVKTVDKDGNALTQNTWGWAYARKKSGDYGPGSEFGNGLQNGTTNIPLLGGYTYLVGVHLPPEQSDYIMDEEVEVYIPVNGSKEAVVTLVVPDAEIYGFLKDQDGKVITGYEAEIYANVAEKMGPGGPPGAFTRVNPNDGSFSLRVRGGNKYVLGYWFRESPDFVQTHPDFAPFTVAVNGRVAKIITAFRANTYVDATLLDPDGKTIEFGYVWCSNFMFLEDKVKGDFEGGKVIDAGNEVRNGHTRVNLISGQYECGAGQWNKEGSLYMPPEAVVVNVTKTSPAQITLQFREADAYLKGNVTLEEGGNVPFGWCHGWQEEGGFTGSDIFDGEVTLPLTIGTWYVGCDSHIPENNKFYRSEEIKVVVSSKGDISKDFVLEPGLFDIPEGITESFEATSQKVITLPDGTTLTIPANALATEGNVTVMASPNVNVFFTKDTKPIAYAWDFEALDSNQQLISEFNSNVTISIPYSQDVVDELGLNEENLVAKYYDDTAGVWKLPDGVTQDLDGNIINFSVNHFTDFAVTTGQATGAAALENGPYNIVATPMTAGGPQVAVFTKDGQMIATWFAYSSALRMGLTTEVADLDGDGEVEIITIPGEGFDAQLRIFDKNGNVLSQFMAYDAGFRKGVNIAIYDLDGNGEKEIITVPAKEAAADVKVFSKDGSLLARFNAYGSGYNLGAEVGAIDLDGDGNGEIVAYPVTGSGQVRVFNKDGNVLTQFNSYGDGYNKGIHLTLSDLDGDGTVEIITSPKNSIAHVKVFNKDGGLLAQFVGYASTFIGGARTYVGDVNGDGDKDIVVLPDTNGSAQARVFDKDGNLLSQFFAYPSNIKGSFSAVVGDLDGDGIAEISFGPEAGLGPQVRVFDKDGGVLSQFFTLHSGYRGGINITLINQ